MMKMSKKLSFRLFITIVNIIISVVASNDPDTILDVPNV